MSWLNQILGFNVARDRDPNGASTVCDRNASLNALCSFD
jgi:hypothetical protein